jgi:hypothetical protein
MVKAGKEAQSVSWTIHDAVKRGAAIVLSHCCEVARDNGVKLTAITLAPIRESSKATKPDKLEELKRTNDIRTGHDASYLKYFYIEPDFRLGPDPAGYIADFSKCFTFHKTAYDQLLTSKRLQMDDATRLMFSLKLAVFFHRTIAEPAPDVAAPAV